MCRQTLLRLKPYIELILLEQILHFDVIEYQSGKNVDDGIMYLAGHSLYLIVGHVLLAIAAVYNKMLVG